jgi:hypothetical protein
LFIAANAATVQQSPNATELCDAGFYSEPLAPSFPSPAISLVQHEANLMSIPFCCTVLAAPAGGDPYCQADADAKGYAQAYAAALQFCTTLNAGLQVVDVNLCPSLTTEPSASPSESPTMEPSSSAIVLEKRVIVFVLLLGSYWLV